MPLGKIILALSDFSSPKKFSGYASALPIVIVPPTIEAVSSRLAVENKMENTIIFTFFVGNFRVIYEDMNRNFVCKYGIRRVLQRIIQLFGV